MSVVGEVGFLLPVGLHEDTVDGVDADGFVGAADGLDEAADAEVAGLAEDAVGGSDDEVAFPSRVTNFNFSSFSSFSSFSEGGYAE